MKMEILAPAGDETMLRAAVYSGADCVYLGVKGFNARSSAANFAKDEGDSLAQAVAFCHARNCKVYAAVNTLCTPGNLPALEEAVAAVKSAGCDAVIVQDLQTAAIAKRIGGLDVHGSTQMSVHSLAGVLQLAEMGFTRVILSRELGLEEIAEIAKNSPIELEVFVHGALCISVSGQCYMSAFVGGKNGKNGVRSANAGSCASPCRLPFHLESYGGDIAELYAKQRAGENDTYALSLKDLSVLKALPKLQELGVASAKIEGRLRGPEYCAAVVDAAQKALRGEAYDEAFLQEIFSRSGFTDAWLNPIAGKCAAGQDTAAMFGRRTQADTEKSRKALPQARALYRREMPRVAVHAQFAIDAGEAVLTLQDGQNTVLARRQGNYAAAQKPMREEIIKALGKMGGTPFFMADEPDIKDNGYFISAAEVGALRREALEELLALREKLPNKTEIAAAAQKRPPLAPNPRVVTLRQKKTPLLRARFERLEQMPEQAAQLCEELLFPLWQAEQIPEALRAKSRLYLPRVLFGKAEEAAQKQMQKAAEMGFRGFEAQNISHLYLCKNLQTGGGSGRGMPPSGGFGLNITNAGALYEYAQQGLEAATLSIELSAAELKKICADAAVRQAVASDMLCYGYLPLMITRSCPAQGQKAGACMPQAVLVDRMGAAFPTVCGGEAVRTIYNSVPLWLLDKLDNVPTDFATLYFTLESKRQAAAVLQAAVERTAPKDNFTRGFY